MKYIKKFNESLNITKDEFVEQCETYLAELNDLNMQVSITVFDTLIVVFINENDGSDGLFEWEYIKEVMITFLDFLRHKYKIRRIMICDEYEDEEGDNERELTFDEITSDDFNSSEITYLEIKLI